MTAQVTDIERAAVRMLAKDNAEFGSERLMNHVTRIIQEPEYTEILTEVPAPEVEFANRAERVFVKLQDRARWALANAIATYRRNGKPAGDTLSTFSEMGVTFTVTTSLAAAVVDYHEAVLNALATKMDLEAESG